MLPRLPARVRRYQQEIVALRGVNYTDSFTDGDLAQCTNLSTRRWPCLCARWGRVHLDQYDGATALTAWEELVVVKAGRLLYGGQDVGAVSPGGKQFAVLNTKLVIWPDKKYLDLQSKTLHDMGASVSGSGAVFTTNTLQLFGSSGKFKAGDTVTVSGSSIAANNKDVTIKAVSGNTLTVEDNTFTAGASSTAVTVTRRIPDLDFICESENRLWGCSNATRTIYASALGDPTNFFNYQGLSTDSYAVAVGSEGDFTGCCRISSAVLFWKERTLHKILGSYPAEYAQYSYSVEGLKAGCHKSLQVVNETLYYMGESGVHAYSGGTPSRISAGFEGKDFRNAVAGTDGERYYLSVTEGQQSHLFTCDLGRGIWLREDETKCVDFARLGSALYFLTSEGKVWQTRGGEDAGIEWEARFTPFYETVTGRKRYSMYQDEGEKQRLNLQMIAALEQEDYAKYQDLLSQYNTDRSFAYNQYRDQIGDDRYADETAWNRGVYQDETDYNRGIYADETDYNRKQLRAKQLAETGDFSGYLDLGYSQEEVDRMQAAFFIQHPELAALNTTGAGGLAGNAALANTIGADSMGNAIYYDASGVGRYSDGTIYGGDPGGIPSYVLNNYAGGGSAKPWNKWADVEDWAGKYGADSAKSYIKEHYKELGYKSQSTALAGWENHLTETGGISAGGGGTSGGGTSGGGGGSGYSYSYTPAAQDSGDTGTITSVSQLGPEALRIINHIDPRPNYVSTQVQKGLANGTITEAEADYLLRAIGY